MISRPEFRFTGFIATMLVQLFEITDLSTVGTGMQRRLSGFESLVHVTYLSIPTGANDIRADMKNMENRHNASSRARASKHPCSRT